jgi:hypothetical protein
MKKQIRNVQTFVAVLVLIAFYSWGGYLAWWSFNHPEVWESQPDQDPHIWLPVLLIGHAIPIGVLIIAVVRLNRRRAKQKRAFDAAIARAEEYIRQKRFQEAKGAIKLATRIMYDNR